MHTSLTLGALIREARERAGLTRAELARRARTSPSAVARYETGQSSPKIETARRCLDACGFEVWLCVEPVDFRKQIPGLAALVQDTLAMDPFSAHPFVFTNRRRTLEGPVSMWSGNSPRPIRTWAWSPA